MQLRYGTRACASGVCRAAAPFRQASNIHMRAAAPRTARTFRWGRPAAAASPTPAPSPSPRKARGSTRASPGSCASCCQRRSWRSPPPAAASPARRGQGARRAARARAERGVSADAGHTQSGWPSIKRIGGAGHHPYKALMWAVARGAECAGLCNRSRCSGAASRPSALTAHLFDRIGLLRYTHEAQKEPGLRIGLPVAKQGLCGLTLCGHHRERGPDGAQHLLDGHGLHS